MEAYRGGDLVAFDSTDAQGGFAIALPVRYGENPVDFVAYGPFGEIREFNRTYRVLTELLPPGRFEYGLSAGQCRSTLCETTANLDLRYGASPRWTVQGGLDQFWRDTVPDRLHPYAAVVANPTNAWAVQGEVVGRGFARGTVRYEPTVDFRLEGDYTRFARDSVSLFAPPGRRGQWSVTGFLRPRTRQGFFFFDGRLEQSVTDVGRTTEARLGASVQRPEVRLLPFARVRRDAPNSGSATSREFVGLQTFVLPRAQWGAFLAQVLVRANAEIERRAGRSWRVPSRAACAWKSGPPGSAAQARAG